jgi:hypothetical protein
LSLPGPNAFIPEKLDVEKFEVKEVRLLIRYYEQADTLQARTTP